MGIAERKAREKLIRHQQILGAAYEVFNEVGFFAATMDQIAERAELAKGTIYIYFKSKEEVYFSLLTNGLDILIALLEEMEKAEPPPNHLLEQTARTLFRFYKDHTSYFRIFMTMQQEHMQAKLSPELAQQLNAQATTILNLLSAKIQKVVDNGALPSINPWHVANILWGAFTGITQLAITREQLRVTPRHIDELLSLCFDLISRGLSAETKAPRQKPKRQGSGTKKLKDKGQRERDKEENNTPSFPRRRESRGKG
jgi:AcrR family transcriptional regulator